MLSDAVDVRVIVPDTLPLAGEVIDTVGGELSTVIVIMEDVVELLAPSQATSETLLQTQENLNLQMSLQVPHTSVKIDSHNPSMSVENSNSYSASGILL